MLLSLKRPCIANNITATHINEVWILGGTGNGSQTIAILDTE
jgi:hypothetical protein